MSRWLKCRQDLWQCRWLILVHSNHSPDSELVHRSGANTDTLHTLLDYPDSYVQPLVVEGLRSMKNLHTKQVNSVDQLPQASELVLQIAAYEQLNFEHALDHPTTSLICAYAIRKALIRKHYLSSTI